MTLSALNGTFINPASPSPPARRILLVDDHPICRHGIRSVVEANRKYEVCAEASDLPRALNAMRTQNPDLAIVDIALPGQNGLELIKALLAERPRLPILVVSMHEETSYALRAFRAGARGYVQKSNFAGEIVEALERISTGALHISPIFRESLIFRLIDLDPENEQSPLDPLSEREVEILGLIGQGFSTRRIAETLGISVKTVETHRARAKEKLHMRDGGELVKFATDWIDQQNEMTHGK